METEDNTVQTSTEDTKIASKKKRSQADKVGKFKYLMQKERETVKDIAEIKLMLRTLLNGMKSSLRFDQPTIEKFSAETKLTENFCGFCLKLALLVYYQGMWRLNLSGSKLQDTMLAADYVE